MNTPHKTHAYLSIQHGRLLVRPLQLARVRIENLRDELHRIAVVARAVERLQRALEVVLERANLVVRGLGEQQTARAREMGKWGRDMVYVIWMRGCEER